MPLHHPQYTTVEHVWPFAIAIDANRIGNTVLAHQKCNSEKNNRAPRGCEVLFLFATNRRLGYTEEETAKWDQPLVLTREIKVRKVG